MKGKVKRKGGPDGINGGSNGIVIEAVNRKARRKEQRLAKKKKQHPTPSRRQQHQADDAPPTTNAHNIIVSDNHNNDGPTKKKSKRSVDENADGSNNNKRVVKFSNTIEEKTIPSVKNKIPTGLKRSKKKNKRHNDNADEDDEEYMEAQPPSLANYYEDYDDETATAFRRDDVEIDYLERELGINKKKKSNKNKKDASKELNREYSKNEGFGDDFGDFLSGLDDLVDRCVGGENEDGNEEDSEGSGGVDGDESEGENEGEVNEKKIFDSGEDDYDNHDDDYSMNDFDSNNGDDEDPYANLDEDTALAFRSDDAEIAALEEKLGLSSSSKKARKKLNKEFASAFQGYGEDFGDFLDDLDRMGDKIGFGADDDVRHDDDDGASSEDEGFLQSSDEEDEGRNNTGSNEDEGSDGSDEDSNSDEEEDVANIADHDAALTYRPASGEDIYGNKIDPSAGGTAKPTKYIPPHLRKKVGAEASAAAEEANESDNESEANEKKKVVAADPETIKMIQRQLNNALNRLSSQTLESVSKSIAAMYSQYPFHDMNDCLWKNVLSACVPPHMVMSGLIPLYIGAVSGVHWLGGDGIQLGGSLVEWSVSRLVNSLKLGRTKKEDGSGGGDQVMINKEASNLLLIVCYLYNFGVVHCSLIYDLVRDFIDNFAEIDVEALLIILSHCGGQLRSDDPSALREIVLLVKERAQKAAEADSDFTADVLTADSSRIQYMVDTITELKNNKPRKQDAVLREKTNVLKKCISRVKSSASQSLGGKKSGSCLRLTLKDILDAETKGRWWIGGAFWAGNQYREDQSDNEDGDNDAQSNIRNASNRESSSKKESNEDGSLLALASSQRMNTDARRSIFCIVMGSSDCDDAFEKLVRQGLLKPKAERDAIRVIVHCCGEEKAFNPFYAYLALRACEYQGKSRFTLMLTFWDIFKQLHTFSIRKVANLAKLLAHLIGGGGDGELSKQCLTIGVLKRIEFSPSDMPEMVIVFLSIFMTDLLETCNIDIIQKIFARGMDESSSSSARKAQVESDDEDESAGRDRVKTTKKEDLSDLRESLSVFMLQYVKSSPKNTKGTIFHANYLAAFEKCSE